MASTSTFAVILVFVALGAVLAEAAGRPSGTLQGWNGESIHDKDIDSSSSSSRLDRVSIPAGLMASPLDAERTAKYLAQIHDNTLGSHSQQFCQEAQLECSADLAIRDPTLRISRSRLADQELFQQTSDLVEATRAMQFDRNDIAKDSDIVLPQNLHDSHPAVAFLPQALADKMPFTSAEMPELFEKLSIPQDSNLAIMMARTVSQCEAQDQEQQQGLDLAQEQEQEQGQGKNIRKCVTSLEGMKTFVSSNLPQGKRIVALDRSSSIPGTGESRRSSSSSSNNEEKRAGWKVVDTQQYDRAVVCRNSVFPYAVFECHDTSKSSMRIFQVQMQSRTDGARISEVAACHENSAAADQNRQPTTLTASEPAQACHWLTDSVIWAAAN